jgi:prepilin-type N-terminal cleavage/methylation domain-containing protein
VNAHRRDERGFTLIELIIAITLMGLAVGAVFGGLGLFFKIQDTQQSNARIDAEIRNYAERILAQPYTDCATAASYEAATAPTGLSSTVAVQYWDGKLPASFGSTCTADVGLQQITIVLTDDNGANGTLVIGKSR